MNILSVCLLLIAVLLLAGHFLDIKNHKDNG